MIITVINPQIKLNWAETHWSAEESGNAKKWVQEAVCHLISCLNIALNSAYQMLIHQQAIRRKSKSNISTSVGRRKVQFASTAAHAQASGMSRLNALAKSLSADSLDTDSDATSSETPAASSSPPSDEDLHLQDIAIIQEELQRWISLGIMRDEAEIEDFDLVRFWQVGGT
jgi:hypothetical protein